MEKLITLIRKIPGIKLVAETSYFWITTFGIDPMKFFRAIKGLPILIREYHLLKKQNKQIHEKYKLHFKFPNPHEKKALSGQGSGHYFHQDLYVARKIFQNNPEKQVDVGSRIDGFIAHVASFRTIEVFDIRPQSPTVANIIFTKANLMNLQPELTNYCDSLSCLHALEHFGLGRYGDKIDIEGHLAGINNFHKILKKNGYFYLSVPIGPERIDFNGHRVFSIQTILDIARGKFDLICFSFIDDDGNFHENITIDQDKIQSSCGCQYGCGVFEFKKVE